MIRRQVNDDVWNQVWEHAISSVVIPIIDIKVNTPRLEPLYLNDYMRGVLENEL